MTANAIRPPTPPRTEIRRFGLGDLMILVAAVAFSSGRSWSAVQRAMGIQPFFTSEAEVKRAFPSAGFAILESGLMMATFALTAMSLRPPRPRRARLMRRPGWIACFAGSTGLLLGMAIDWADSPTRRSYQYGYQYMLYHDMNHPAYMTLFAGSSILISWLILAAGGHGRSAPTWPDRAGRALGVGWLAMFAGSYWLHLGWQPM